MIKVSWLPSLYSHEPPVFTILPKSHFGLKICPGRVSLYSLKEQGVVVDLNLKIEGPVADFTVSLDLEKGRVVVFGTEKKGYFRYILEQEEEGIVFLLDKRKEKLCITGFREVVLAAKDKMMLPFPEKRRASSSERFSFGIYKKPDWDLVQRRLNLKEIFPFWLKLATLLSSGEALSQKGAFGLLKQCEDVKDPAKILPLFSSLFQVAFHGMFFPEVQDHRFLGILPQEEPFFENPLPLITQGAKAITSLFFKEERSLTFLPQLPPGFDAGKVTGLLSKKGDEIAFEWSKSLLRKIVFKGKEARSVLFQFPKEIRSVRIRKHRLERGVKHALLKGFLEIEAPSGFLFFDRFEK